MRRTDEELRQRVRRSWQGECREDAPAFDDVWRRSETRFATSRRQYARLAAVVVALRSVPP